MLRRILLILISLTMAGTLGASDLDYLGVTTPELCGPAQCTPNAKPVLTTGVIPVSPKAVQKTVIKYYFSPQCPHCRELKRTLLPRLRKDYAQKIEIQEYDIQGNPVYLQELILLTKNHRNEAARIPAMLIDGQLWVGTHEITYARLQKILGEVTPAHSQTKEQTPALEKVTPEKGFPAVRLLVLAAFLDGINPCAFATIIFFVTYLNFLKKDRKTIAQIGLAFVLGVFVCYFLLGLGVFHILLKLKAYDWISYWFSKLLGVAALILGVLSLYDFYVYKKTGQSSEMVLQLPAKLKQRVHALIRRGVKP